MMSTIGTLICGSSSRGSETSGERARDERGEQEKRGQRRIDEGAGEETRKAELHGDDQLVAVPAGRPESRHSTSRAAPSWTTTSAAVGELDVVDAGAAVDARRAER